MRRDEVRQLILIGGHAFIVSAGCVLAAMLTAYIIAATIKTIPETPYIKPNVMSGLKLIDPETYKPASCVKVNSTQVGMRGRESLITNLILTALHNNMSVITPRHVGISNSCIIVAKDDDGEWRYYFNPTLVHKLYTIIHNDMVNPICGNRSMLWYFPLHLQLHHLDGYETIHTERLTGEYMAALAILQGGFVCK